MYVCRGGTAAIMFLPINFKQLDARYLLEQGINLGCKQAAKQAVWLQQAGVQLCIFISFVNPAFFDAFIRRAFEFV